MKPYTKEFIQSLVNLLEEYDAKIELEGDKHTGVFEMVLETKNPQPFNEHFDSWFYDNPLLDYPSSGDLYSQYDWTDLGNLLDVSNLKELLK